MLTDLLAATTGPCALVAARHGHMLCFRRDAYVGRSLLSYGEWCEQELELLAPACRPGDVVVDAGANVGTHALAFAHRVGPGGAVHAFEPQAPVAHLLGANAAMNGLPQISVHRSALGDRAGTVQVPRLDPALGHNLGGLALDGPTGDGSDQEEPVPLQRLDAVLDPPGLRLLKVDVEGMEAAVIRGAGGLIERFRPLLYVENDRRDRSDALIGLIEGHGYRLYWHLAPLFDPRNFAGEAENIFPGLVSVNMVGVHEADVVQGPALTPVVRGDFPFA